MQGVGFTRALPIQQGRAHVRLGRLLCWRCVPSNHPPHQSPWSLPLIPVWSWHPADRSWPHYHDGRRKHNAWLQFYTFAAIPRSQLAAWTPIITLVPRRGWSPHPQGEEGHEDWAVFARGHVFLSTWIWHTLVQGLHVHQWKTSRARPWSRRWKDVLAPAKRPSISRPSDEPNVYFVRKWNVLGDLRF